MAESPESSSTAGRAVRWTSALSNHKDMDPALDELLDALIPTLDPENIHLLLVFATTRHERALEDAAGRLKRAFPHACLLGCAARGIFGAGREIEEDFGIAAAAAQFKAAVTISPFHFDGTKDLPHSRAAWLDTLKMPSDATPHFILLADPFFGETQRLLNNLDQNFPQSTKMGGLASGGAFPGSSALLSCNDIHYFGITGIAMHGEFILDSIVAQGCRPIGHPMFVTKTRGNVILELDAGPPVKVLHELHESLSPRDKTLFSSSPLIGIRVERHPLTGFDSPPRSGDFLIRHIGSIDAGTGALELGAVPHKWSVVQFHIRDVQSAMDELDSQLARYKAKHLHDPPPSGALVCSCLGRGQAFFGQAHYESNALKRCLGDIPMIGFFGNGEIGAVGGSTFLHSYTSALALFH